MRFTSKLFPIALATALLLFSFQNCQSSSFQPASSGTRTDTSTDPGTETGTSTGTESCALPWGGAITNGASVTAYSSSAPADSCSSTSETRTCSNGVLSGSYTNQACSNGCALPWGGAIANGASVTAYSSSSPADSCSSYSETRICSNGVLSGSNAYQTCSSTGTGSCALPWGGTIAHGASVTAYSSSSPADSCSSYSETRTCSNGVLSGSNTYQTCSSTGSCTLPWGGTIAHGASVTAYSSSAPAGSCSSYSETRTCSNGVLSGSNTYQTCSNGCTLPWGGSIAHGQMVTAYSSTTSGCASSCSSNSEDRTCNSGTLSGSYNNQSCADTCQYYGFPKNLQGRNLAAPAETNFCEWKHGAGATVYSAKTWKIFNYGNEPCFFISTSGNSDVNSVSECIVSKNHCEVVGCNIFEYIYCQW